MKKITLISMMLVLTMMFFAGCNDSGSGGGSGGSGSSGRSSQSGPQQGSDITGSGSQMSGSTGASAKADIISETEAREIALNHAGFKADEVTRLRTEYDVDDGVQKYEIEFYKDNVEYDYEINAVNGNIISYNRDRDFD